MKPLRGVVFSSPFILTNIITIVAVFYWSMHMNNSQLKHFNYLYEQNLTNLKDYFNSLIQTHSWSSVKIDRNGLQFFYRYTLILRKRVTVGMA